MTRPPVPADDSDRSWPLAPPGPRSPDASLQRVNAHRVRLVRISRKLLAAFILFFPLALALYAGVPLLTGLGGRTVVSVLFPTVLLGMVLFLLLLGHLLPLATFDRGTGVAVIGRIGAQSPGPTSPVPLRISMSEILAVQFLEKPGRRAGEHCAECNLVTSSGKRISLLNHGEPDLVLREATMLADFLGVELHTVVFTPDSMAPRPPV